MSAGITERDLQTGLNQAWHQKTNIVEVVTRDNSMPFEVIEAPIIYKTKKTDFFGVEKDVLIEDPEYKRLIASDDFLPIGEPYGNSYHPTSISTFWEIIRKGMGDTPHQIISAGTVDNRQKIFASIKMSDGFRVGDREFKDYITLIDSFDKSTALQSRYSNVCVVCANTFAAVMKAGDSIGKAKHTAMIEVNIQRLIDSINTFVGASQSFQRMLSNAHQITCSRDEARAWIAGVEGRNTGTVSNGLKQKVARMMELFESGRGNEGRTRLDAFSALTDFHSNESTNRKGEGAQSYTSEWGTSAQTKNLVASSFEATWDQFVNRGNRLLSEDKNLLPA